MVEKILTRFSSLLYKVHLRINNLLKAKSSFEPYKLGNASSECNLKIIHINGNFMVGGTSQLIVDIIERTSDKYSHTIVVPEYPEPLPYQPVSIQKFSLYQIPELFRFLKGEKPDLVHIHYWVREKHKYEWFALWYNAVFNICEELNFRVIQNVNVPTQPHLSSSNLHNVFVSKYVLDNFNNSSVTSSVIYPGSNFYHFKNDAIDSLPDNCIGMVYRLDKDKLNADAIEVFIAAVKMKKGLQCYIIGEGEYLKYYKKRVAEEGLEYNFIFPGVISYSLLPEYYKKFSVFVAPVHDESFGQVTPFAMSMGLSVVGYNTGALSEILGGEETLVEYGNIEELAKVIIDLVNNPDKRKELGKRNQERAHMNYTVEKMIQQYNDLYALYTA